MKKIIILMVIILGIVGCNLQEKQQLYDFTGFWKVTKSTDSEINYYEVDRNNRFYQYNLSLLPINRGVIFCHDDIIVFGYVSNSHVRYAIHKINQIDEDGLVLYNRNNNEKLYFTKM